VYSLEDGSQSGAIFANKFDISKGGLLAVGAGDNRVQVYDADTLEQVDQYSFAEPITIAMFLPDGHRLLVITRDQTVFVLDPRREPADLQTAAN
jgi:WD40 repeat protein